MTRFTQRIALLFLAASIAWAGDWTEPVDVLLDLEKCVSYQAKLDGDHLVVRVTHEKGWHTYAMDNVLRAEEKLAGKQSLGIDGPTQIAVSGGLKVSGPWHQSEPLDLSKPEFRWFTWGYDDPALFTVKADRAGGSPAQIAIRGQACDATRCKNIDVVLSLPVPASGTAGAVSIDLNSLVKVRKAN